MSCALSRGPVFKTYQAQSKFCVRWRRAEGIIEAVANVTTPHENEHAHETVALHVHFVFKAQMKEVRGSARSPPEPIFGHDEADEFAVPLNPQNMR